MSKKTKYVYYVQVGNLPRDKAEAHMKRVMKAWRKCRAVKKNRTIFVPIRDGDGETRIEVLPQC
jgi:hypothetical protein